MWFSQKVGSFDEDCVGQSESIDAEHLRLGKLKQTVGLDLKPPPYTRSHRFTQPGACLELQMAIHGILQYPTPLASCLAVLLVQIDIDWSRSPYNIPGVEPDEMPFYSTRSGKRSATA